MKVCSKCNIEKPFEDFNKGRGSCKLCTKEYDRIKYLNNSEKYREYSKKRYKDNPEYQKKWVIKNKDKRDSTLKKWNEENREKAVQYTLKWRSKNTEKYNQYMVDRRKNEPLFKLAFNVRKRLNKFLKNKSIIKTNKTFDLVGITPKELKEHLEKQFFQGMSWGNYGEWHIDHIIPLSSAKTEDEIYKLCHYTNLQPLWAEDNLRKGNKLIKQAT
jgi:hypothetical protein